MRSQMPTRPDAAKSDAEKTEEAEPAREEKPRKKKAPAKPALLISTAT